MLATSTLGTLSERLKAQHSTLVELSRAKSAPTKPEEAEYALATTVVAHENLGKAGKSLCQAARALYFLLQDGPPPADQLAGCARDLEAAAALYDSWARALFAVVLPAVRKSIGPACCQVLHSTVTLVAAAHAGSLQPSDMGPMESACAMIEALETSASACCLRLVRESGQMVADALRELHESIAEAVASNGSGDEDDDDDDDEEKMPAVGEDEEMLLSRPALSRPLTRLVVAMDSTLRLVDTSGAVYVADSDKALGMLITCAQLASERVDALVGAADEDDVDTLVEHGTSLAKLAAKTHQVLAANCAGLRELPERVALEAEPGAALEALRAAAGLGAISQGIGALCVS